MVYGEGMSGLPAGVSAQGAQDLLERSYQPGEGYPQDVLDSVEKGISSYGDTEEVVKEKIEDHSVGVAGTRQLRRLLGEEVEVPDQVWDNLERNPHCGSC